MKQPEHEKLMGYVQHGKQGYPEAAIDMIKVMLDDCELEGLKTDLPAIRLAPAFRECPKA